MGSLPRLGPVSIGPGLFYRNMRLANKNDPQLAPLDVNNVVGEVISLLQREWVAHQVRLQLELAPALPAVLADRVELQQVLVNLVTSGIEAMQPVTDRARELVLRSRRDDAQQVLVTVRDSGFRNISRGCRPAVHRVLRHPVRRHGHGTVDLPFDR
jgi:C4-dicarboxylate-specific signal transduction histidine kinase